MNLRGFSVVVAAICLCTAVHAEAEPLICPPSVTVAESSDPVADWTVSAPHRKHRFAGFSVVNSEIGNEEATLAPDEEHKKGKHLTQLWRLSDYRDRPLHLLCHYIHTDVTLSAMLPAEIKTCESTFPFDEKIGTIDDPDDPPKMSCR